MGDIRDGRLRYWRVSTSYGYVRVVGRSRQLARAALPESACGKPMHRLVASSVERMIERAERMNQNVEMN